MPWLSSWIQNNTFSTSGTTQIHGRMGRSLVVLSNLTTLYHFYKDVNADLAYTKSTDSGVSWGTAVVVKTGTVSSFEVWYDQWTTGIAGTVIHCAYIDAGAHDVFYRSLETATDTLGTETTIFAGASVASNPKVSISEAIGARLVCAYNLDEGSEEGFATSVDAGANWVVKASPGETTTDDFLLFPGNETDTQDVWLLYMDRSANALTVKTYDDSGDSWSESTTIFTVVEPASPEAFPQYFGGAIDPDDNHLIIAAWNATDTAGADIDVADFNGAASITALTDALVNADNCCILGIQVRAGGQINIYQGGKSDASDAPSGTFGSSRIGLYRMQSTDDGATWASQELVSSGWRSDFRNICVDLLRGDYAVVSAFPVDNNDINRAVLWRFSASAGGGGGGGGLLGRSLVN